VFSLLFQLISFIEFSFILFCVHEFAEQALGNSGCGISL